MAMTDGPEGPVMWVPRFPGSELEKAHWNIRWLIKIAKDERLTAAERVSVIANFPASGIEPVVPTMAGARLLEYLEEEFDAAADDLMARANEARELGRDAEREHFFEAAIIVRERLRDWIASRTLGVL